MLYRNSDYNKTERIHPVILGSNIISAYGTTLIQRHRQVMGEVFECHKKCIA